MKALRIDGKSHPLQTKLEGDARHAIPRGLLHMLDRQFERVTEADDEKPAGLFHILDESHSRYVFRHEQSEEKESTVKCATCCNLMTERLAKKTEAMEEKWREIHARYV